VFNPRERSRPITFFAFLLIVCWFCDPASAKPSITLSRKSGPPTSRILVSGRGFESNVGVDIFFGTKDKALVVTDREGEFRDARIYAPRGARPGKHWVTALERNNDKGAQEPFVVDTTWEQFRFTVDHAGVNPYENTLNPKTVQGLNLKWSYPTNVVSSSPAVSNGVVYVGSWDFSVYALNAQTGARLWSYHTGSYIDASPAVANGVVYVSSEDGKVYALKASNGALLWRYATGAAVASSPAVANGVVYVCSDNVYALHASTGTKIWSYPAQCNYSSPAVANGVVYIGSGDHNVYALNAKTGSKLWSYRTGGFLNSSPAVVNGTVYIGSEDDFNVYAIDAGTGIELWSYHTAYYVDSSPAVVNGVVYIGSQDGHLYALNASNGAVKWSYLGGELSASPAVANGVVYGATTSFYAVNAETGAQLWRYPNGGNTSFSSPAVANGVVYVGSGGDSIYAFGLARSAVGEQATSQRPDFTIKVSKPDATLAGEELRSLQR
jgi:outer membrane protein assembly factor BamB